MEQYVIIVAGGTGSRMKSEMPKQFIEINGEAIIIKTIKKFIQHNKDSKIIVVVHPEYELYLKTLLEKSMLSALQITVGGATRFDSVKNGLNLIPNSNALVAIHDAARPFVSIQTIANCFDIAAKKGNAIPCLNINESIRQVTETDNKIANRDAFKIIQTPQCFMVSKIKKSFEQNYQVSFTDDATILETTGEKINLVEGNIENIKITSPFDLIIAKAFSEHE